MAMVPAVASVAVVAPGLVTEWEERNAHGEDCKKGSALALSVCDAVWVGRLVAFL